MEVEFLHLFNHMLSTALSASACFTILHMCHDNGAKCS